MSKKRYLVVFFISLLAISMLSMSVSALLLPDGSYCTYKSQCQSGFCVHNVCRSSSPYCGDKYCDYGENCGTCSGDCGCGAGKECINSECKTSDGNYCYYATQCANNYCVHNTCRSSSTHCGDGYCDSGECSSCTGDCSLYNCRYNGQCDTAVGEKCNNAGSDCSCGGGRLCLPTRPGADSMGCYEIECGDGYLDSGENRNTCCRDAGCYGGKKCHEGKNKCVDCVSDGDCRNQVCDPKSNICVRCYNDGHCGSGKCNTVTHQCVECIKDEDCESKTIWDNQFFCSPDHNSVMEKGRIVSGKCDVRTQTCKGEETPTTRTAKNCRTQQTYCQDKVCGCAEDYAPCTAEGMCVKKAVLNENDPCGCDFQCTSGYCAPAGKTCFKAVSAEFSETRTKLTVGEESEVTLSVNNHLDKDVFAKILINKGSGASISSEVEGADICAGNQCTASSKIPAKSSNRITLKLQGQDNVVVPITAEVTYQVYAGSKKAQKLYTATALEKEITYVICGDGQCNSDVGEDKTNCCGDCAYPQSTFFREYSCPNPKEGYVSKAKVRNYIYSFLAFIILALIVLGLIYSRKLRSIRRTRMDKIKVEKEKENATKRRERNKIRKAFKLIDDKIDHKKPPTARTVKKWLKKGFNMEFNDKLFNEEYVILVGELEEEAKQKETEEKIKQKEAEQKNKRKFCRKCGGTLKKPGAKFCTKCGAKQ